MLTSPGLSIATHVITHTFCVRQSARSGVGGATNEWEHLSPCAVTSLFVHNRWRHKANLSLSNTPVTQGERAKTPKTRDEVRADRYLQIPRRFAAISSAP